MKRFPADGILGEEFGTHNPDAARRWIIDPIDGTAVFARGVPLWGTLVAVIEGDDILAGAIYCPAVNELVCAAPGTGCWWNGSRTKVSDTADLSEAYVLTTDTRFIQSGEKLPRLHRLVASARPAADGEIVMDTARRDRARRHNDRSLMSHWDAAALVPVIEEAGGFHGLEGTADCTRRGCGRDQCALATEVRRFS